MSSRLRGVLELIRIPMWSSTVEIIINWPYWKTEIIIKPTSMKDWDHYKLDLIRRPTSSESWPHQKVDLIRKLNADLAQLSSTKHQFELTWIDSWWNIMISLTIHWPIIWDIDLESIWFQNIDGYFTAIFQLATTMIQLIAIWAVAPWSPYSWTFCYNKLTI